ncbi:DUF4214 domain-containing protein [Halomonas sp.]|uniref:DUF4214 domain-containing protein n=1 Tax=Halomonas sp. TaxID=1486246 RepID=UPI003D0FDDCB
MPFDVQPNTLIFGSQGADTLSATGGNIAIGLDGNDTLSAYGWLAVLHGGQGSDYYQADAWVTQIVDSGGADDSLSVSGHFGDYAGGFIDDHLLLYNTWNGDAVLVLDWHGSGRIEHLGDSYGNYLTPEQIDAEVARQGYADLSYRDLADALGVQGLGAAEMRALVEMDERFGNLDWQSVFEALATSDLNDGWQVAGAIRDEAFADLSPAARSLWDEVNYDAALANSGAFGFAENIASTNRPVAESVALLYAAALDRQPDESGYNYWLERAFEGMGLGEMAGYFLDSEEFQSRFDVASDEAYIERLYLNVLDRGPDADGQAYWEATMDDGLPRNEVLRYFATSEENRDNAEWLAGLARQDDGSWVVEG